ncbi:hypothetical protein A8H35_17670 [Burkholderia thailandensis]|nr:hypothetical protein WJ27_07810 [Burkholderia thailandensis]AVR10464.1 hypothetical protein A8H31_24835 [Burkholderia thailandensis]AWY59926.1 hypothetical protein A8H35_17670 [Burkholderia thailandensis]AWY68966.1 hypothetical protein A8H36_29595 [Burkholderia thailandensis]KVG09077.1 hypothetical protein WJ25_13425 [Burkholderia thailandensis]
MERGRLACFTKPAFVAPRPFADALTHRCIDASTHRKSGRSAVGRQARVAGSPSPDASHAMRSSHLAPNVGQPGRAAK